MGGEFGQFDEWKDLEMLDWFLIEEYEMHRKMFDYVNALNQFYRSEPALWEFDHDPQGFEWINPHDESQSVVTFMRKGKLPKDDLILVCNFTPVYHPDYRIGVPRPGSYQEVFNSDLEAYGGSGMANIDKLTSVNEQWQQFPYSLDIQVPPLAAIYLKCETRPTKKGERKNAK
jgi:1,4-alpha-glucan branching enzyme